MKIRTYNEMKSLDNFEERFEYLKLKGDVGKETFGFDRYLNQRFYQSQEWKNARRYVISRDFGLDLGVEGYEIHSGILVHHMNPISPEDIIHSNIDILDPLYLITTSRETHNAIHYGDSTSLPPSYIERLPGDTKLW